ncbi:hypothetical protein [Altibacter lentus]|uniref:hypothetical protein n=1 Tax=Altibacter lentus TaxID=1223410 RepID=UPI001362C64F|nr:hypothetical protein [Altibacter lentus]
MLKQASMGVSLRLRRTDDPKLKCWQYINEHPLRGFHLLVQKFAEASFDGSIASLSANR